MTVKELIERLKQYEHDERPIYFQSVKNLADNTYLTINSEFLNISESFIGTRQTKSLQIIRINLK